MCAFDFVSRRGVCVILIDSELHTINAAASRCCCCWYLLAGSCSSSCCYCYCYCLEPNKRVQLMFASGRLNARIRADSHVRLKLCLMCPHPTRSLSLPLAYCCFSQLFRSLFCCPTAVCLVFGFVLFIVLLGLLRKCYFNQAAG